MNTVKHVVTLTHHYHFECYDNNGNLKWEEDSLNIVTTEGKNKYLDATLKTGLTTPAWYVGLVGAKTTGYAVGDTLASHGGWTEFTSYTGTRQTWTPGTISNGSVDNSASKASFSINGSGTVNGAFMCSVTSGTAGVLLGEDDFSAGAKTVSSGDTLLVTVTCTMS